jgi:hypothetical protein
MSWLGLSYTACELLAESYTCSAAATRDDTLNQLEHGQTDSLEVSEACEERLLSGLRHVATEGELGGEVHDDWGLRYFNR